MMNYFLRLGVGILDELNINNGIGFISHGIPGSAFALLMYGAPMRIVEKRSTKSFSGLSYAIALLNCLLYTLYGSPLISNGWDNLVVLVINTIGLLLQCCLVCIYLTFAPPKIKRNMGSMVAGVFVMFGTIAIISFCVVHDREHKKVLVGTVGMIATVILYASPLSIIKHVIQTKSVEFMPSFYFSLFAFLGSLLWLAYGAIIRDIIIMAPNFVGVPLALGQMLLHCIYRDSTRVENAKVDTGGQLESNITENMKEDIRDYTHKTKPGSYEDIEMQLNV